MNNRDFLPVKFFRLRPDNFPELRLVQLAAVYHKHNSLFSALVKCSNVKEINKLFDIELSRFWNTHYTFAKEHGFRKKNFTRHFLDLLFINTVVPVNFSFLKSKGKEDFEEVLTMENVRPEENLVIKKFSSLRPGIVQNAKRSQALLKINKNYFEKNACLNCAIGIKLLLKEYQF